MLRGGTDREGNAENEKCRGCCGPKGTRVKIRSKN